MDVCGMPKWLTFTQETEGNELILAQIDDLYGKRTVDTRNEE